MAELIIGRHAHANAVSALRLISPGAGWRGIGTTVGVVGFIVAGLILSFYAIVAGWMIAHFVGSLLEIVGQSEFANWFVDFSFGRNVLFMGLFMVLTAGIIAEGVHDGIERWSSRLMPILIAR